MRWLASLLFAPMIVFAQPAIPQMEIFWLEKVPTDSSITVKIWWYPSATIDTNDVQLIEYNRAGVILQAVGRYTMSDTVNKVSTTIEGFKQNSIVYIRWRAANDQGSSPWSDIMWFATNEMTNKPILLRPYNGEAVN